MGLPVLEDFADGMTRQAERIGAGVNSLFEPTIRLGVTGLSRSGKTVFITSLVANLLNRGRMMGFAPASRIEAAFLQPQPDDTVPRFDYEAHLAALTGRDPHWPDSTRAVSQLRLSLRLRPDGMLSGLRGMRTVHLDIIDYPGEWLLDLGLMEQSYAQWSDDLLDRIGRRTMAAAYLSAMGQVTAGDVFEEGQAQTLARAFTDYLQKARAAGLSDCTPGRFLLPGDLAGAPVLTFAPLPRPATTSRKSLWREMERRFDAYKAQVVRPFFRDHFARIDRQIVLTDLLGAIHDGPEAVEDMRRALTLILSAFRPGRNSWLSRLIGARRVDRILFAATKADHLHSNQHSQLTALMEAMLRDAQDRARFAGAHTAAMAIAALRSTTEEERQLDGATLGCVRGMRLDGCGQAAFYPGALPDDPRAILDPARQGAASWLDVDYQNMRFAPARAMLGHGDGLPHIRLDRAAQFLLGDIL